MAWFSYNVRLSHLLMSYLFHTNMHSTLPLGSPCSQNIAITFGMEKLKRCGYHMVKKFEDTLSCLIEIIAEACDRQTDGRIDKHLAASRGTNQFRQCSSYPILAVGNFGYDRPSGGKV